MCAGRPPASAADFSPAFKHTEVKRILMAYCVGEADILSLAHLRISTHSYQVAGRNQARQRGLVWQSGQH